MNEKLQKLGKRIATLRREAGITQDELALKALIGRRTIHRIETGSTDPRFSTLVKIAEALERQVEMFFR